MNGIYPEHWREGAPEPDSWVALRQDCCGDQCGSMWPCQVADAGDEPPPLHGPWRAPKRVRYSRLFGEQMRQLGGIEAEISLIAHHGSPAGEETS